MVSKPDTFWTDFNQAVDRISGTLVVYDGKPVYVDSIVEEMPLVARLYDCGQRPSSSYRKQLSSPKFNKFRELPKLGFFNLSNGSLVLVNRRVVSTRRHGLCPDNLEYYTLRALDLPNSIPYFELGGRSFNFSSFWQDPGFINTHNNEFPSLDSILKQLKAGAALAYSPNYAVVRDAVGFRWLYRLNQRVGLFSDGDTLLLSQGSSYLREEIMADKAFTCNNIREF